MDLGIAGRRALVCAASKGLGKACALALAREGVHVTLTARSADALEAAAAEIRAATGVTVTTAAGDIATEEGRAAALAACPEPDILVNNAGGPPPGDFRDWEREDWIRALDANMLAPILLIKATVDGMIGRRFGRIVNITSGAVKAPIPILGLSNGARTGLTGFVAGLSRQTVKHNVTINNLLPGPFETDRLRKTMEGGAKASGRSIDEEMDLRRQSNPAGRFGDPDEFGAACAWICSARSGFMTGQNILLDGGAYAGTL
ncbi:3-oxoacyl-[acyl-carrier protein] reductase [Azospirillum agricola]|uniref:SDR family oxidoreductase n=1 Tax=Azospirillum agricola TaxID=1720247 RepID=UPI001AE809E0|nr:SDR family oxidoreductase [Azospirillum agricola]MBP2227454.1 3-oxoacyl-[acyl-carrier protein] reductase [Azospirillum agricola]